MTQVNSGQGYLKQLKARLYSFFAVRLFPVLQSMGFLAGPRFWLPGEFGNRMFRLPLMAGMGMELLRDSGSSPHARAAGRHCWRTGVIEALASRRPGIFVDVGVHLGETLLDLRFANPDMGYLGFEPHNECVHYVRTLIRMNRFRNCSVVGCALSDRSGLSKFYRRGLTDTEATLRSHPNPDYEYEVILTPCVSFDEIRPSLEVEKVSFVKIDVEGSELEVLRGMRKTLRADRPWLVCEVLFTFPSADIETSRRRNAELLSILRQEQYGVWQLCKSEGSREVTDIHPVEEFASAYWSPTNADLCDYLFLPLEHADEALSLLHLSADTCNTVLAGGAQREKP